VIFESASASGGEGEYYSNARWYDPTLGRFLTEDPARDGINLFAYVNNNPLAYFDPTGLYFIPVQPYNLMNGPSPWSKPGVFINGSKDPMNSFGCAIAGMSNIITDFNLMKSHGDPNPAYVFATTPATINADATNFTKPDTDQLDFVATAAKAGLVATKIGTAGAAQKRLKDISNDMKEGAGVLVQVPYTKSDGKIARHWVVAQDLVDLKDDGSQWIRVSPTSVSDNSGRTKNENWTVGPDNSLYVKASAVSATVVVTKPGPAPVIPAPQTKSSDYY